MSQRSTIMNKSPIDAAAALFKFAGIILHLSIPKESTCLKKSQ